MQFHTNGYETGDPRTVAAAPGAYAPGGPFPEQVDVLVVGTGPAGCVLGAQLATFPGISTRVVERRGGPLERGHADGVACRTVEMFQAFGLAGKLLDEAYWVIEDTFWSPDPEQSSRIVRSGRTRDTEDGLSEMPHVIVNQARLQEYLLQRMRTSATRLEPDYGVEFVGLRTETETGGSEDGPVLVTLARDGREFQVRARYVVGCDGAGSRVREAIGLHLHGDRANHAWGVLDLLAVTDFPDWRMKSLIQSATDGNILLIPREGGHLVRLYVDLGEVIDRRATKQTTAEQVLDTARRVLQPYTLGVREIAWFSVYEVGQRLAEKFDDVPAGEEATRLPRVFIAGDACHTHSAKAGQGMNVSMQDAFNIGWKLAAVLNGRSAPELLHTYSAERQAIAHDLIEFDKEWSATISRRPRSPGEPDDGDSIDPAELQGAFVKSGRYTAGLATCHSESLLTGGQAHQGLAAGFPVGMRFHSAPVVRLADAREMHLGHTHEADGRWRLYAFADRDGTRTAALLEHLQQRLLPWFTPSDADPDAVLDVRAVFQDGYRELNLIDLPAVLHPQHGRLRLPDYEKAFAARTRQGTDIFEVRGIDRERGALVLVRPDQYVAHVLPLDAFAQLDAFLGRILLHAA